MVSVLGNYTYEFPQEFPLNKRLKDLLEKEVDEKFYLSDAKTEQFFVNTPQIDFQQSCLGTCHERNDLSFATRDRVYNTEKESPTLTATMYKDALKVLEEPLAYDEQNGYIRKDGTVGTLTTDGSSPKHNNGVIENCYVSEKGVRFICSPKRGMATDINADVCQPLTAKGQSNWTGSFISPDIESIEKSSTIGGTEPTKINLKDGRTLYFDGESFNETEPQVIGGIGEKKSNGGRQWYLQDRIYDNNLATSVTTAFNPYYKAENLRIRKLTPKECYRLMGFDDADYDKAAQVNSATQLYKQAGNSIVVDVLYYIFKGMM
jgi:DNA (cytosine-5)-methyltransferase 1